MAKKKFIARILQEPSYKWNDVEGNLVKPSARQLLKETFSRINIFRGTNNWISFFSASMFLLMSDLAWIYIYCLHKVGMVTSYKDSKAEFLKKFYEPGLTNSLQPLTGDAYTKSQF